MYTSVMSAYLMGLEAVPVQVEVDVSDGLPGFYMVGYVSTQVRETCSRVRTALRNERVTIPPKKITVNLSPGDLPKSGTGFDLPVAAGILEALGRLPAGGLRDILVGKFMASGAYFPWYGRLPGQAAEPVWCPKRI